MNNLLQYLSGIAVILFGNFILILYLLRSYNFQLNNLWDGILKYINLPEVPKHIRIYFIVSFIIFIGLLFIFGGNQNEYETSNDVSNNLLIYLMIFIISVLLFANIFSAYYFLSIKYHIYKDTKKN